MKDQIEIFDFDGIQVPYVSTVNVTVLTNEGEKVRGIPPQYITNLKTFLERESYPALNNAILSMKKEALLSLVRSFAFRATGWEAPTAISAGVPIDHVWIDKRSGRIVLNEWQATQRYIDADGDRATLLFNEDKSMAVLVKFPITSQPMILTVMQEEPVEKFHSLTMRTAKKLMADNPVVQLTDNPELLEEMFAKKHVDVPVGLRTNAWNCFDLWSSRTMNWIEKNEFIFNSFIDQETGKTQRALDIEDAGMKSARKQGKQLEEAWVIDHMKKLGASKALKNEYAWALTSCSSIGDMKMRQLDWFDSADLDAIMTNVANLKLEFRNVEGADLSESVDTFKDGSLLQRLKNLNLVNWEELPHVDKDMPPAILFWLSLPNGQPVALTDVKREGRDEGLTYMYVLAPVYDNVNLYDEAGNVVLGARKEWVHPIDHLQKMLCTFDNTIRPYHNGPVSHYFPADLADWTNTKRSIKVAMLYKFLSDYCGRYGDPAPATRTKAGIVPSAMARSIIRRTVVIDYGRNMNHVEMYRVAMEASKTCNFCMVGSKSTNRRIRKYMLANSKGGTILDPEGITNPYRGACSRAQLQRALQPCKMVVAIVKSDTQNQVFITPTGVEKQHTDLAFLPQVFNTEEEYNIYLSNHKLDKESCPAEIVDYVTWQGEKRRCWTIGARNTIRVGKLIDEIGNKFMPRQIQQAYYKEPGLKDTIEVDLVFPVNELLDKDAHLAYFKNAKERELFLPDGTTIKALIVERTLYRTGSASENIPPRWRKCSFKGIDSFPIRWRLSAIKHLEERTWDSSFAKDLQRAIRQILQKAGAYRTEEDEFLNYSLTTKD